MSINKFPMEDEEEELLLQEYNVSPIRAFIVFLLFVGVSIIGLVYLLIYFLNLSKNS